jgi:hypothetical protein
MAKIQRSNQKKISTQGVDINLETGDIQKPTTDPWSLTLRNQFVKCSSLVEQITEQKLNIVDETNLTTIAHSLVAFGEKGKNIFLQTCLFQTTYETSQLENIWQTATRISRKKPGSFIKLCKEKGLEATMADDEPWVYILKESSKPGRDITDELSESDLEQLREHNHIEYENCYYFARYERDQNGNPKNCYLEKKSNFVLRILYHINRGKNNKRVIVLTNNRGREVILDVETSQLTSFNKFKEVTEGSGNFLFEGTQLDLMKIKNKLFEQEKPCIQIDTLGWYKKGFFTFSNGIYNSTFTPVDKFGIVQHQDCNYYIPYHPSTDENQSQNEKRFAYKESSVTWAQWAPLYFKSFGNAAMPALVFGVATLFSDAIFSMKNNFPMIFLYGEGGSGKGTVINCLQYLFGQPQPALKLSEKANTDKAKIRKLAQFVNSIAFLEEYINDVDMSVKKTITGIWDRLGYERGTIENKFSTEIVPIQSTVMITGNEIPDDDPLLQRLILIDYNINIRSAETVKNFDKLVQLNRQGITPVTGQLLQHRQSIIDQFDKEYREQFNSLKMVYKGPQVPDRMIENNAVLLAVYCIIQRDGRDWPFSYHTFRDFLINVLITQADKRDTGAVLQRFWDIVLNLLNKGIIKNGREIKIQGNWVSIRFKEVHMQYLDEHNRVYRSRGLAANTMIQKLKDSTAFIQPKANERFGEKVTSSYVFHYDKLGVDLLSVLDYKDKEQSKYTPGPTTPLLDDQLIEDNRVIEMPPIGACDEPHS